MKIFHLLLIAVFIAVFSLSGFSGESCAASKKEVTKAEESTKKVATSKKANKAIPNSININTADKEMLEQLPGVGPVTAGSILQYRKTNGKFKSISELTEVKGIGDKTFQKLKPYLKQI